MKVHKQIQYYQQANRNGVPIYLLTYLCKATKYGGAHVYVSVLGSAYYSRCTYFQLASISHGFFLQRLSGSFGTPWLTLACSQPLQEAVTDTNLVCMWGIAHRGPTCRISRTSSFIFISILSNHGGQIYLTMITC